MIENGSDIKVDENNIENYIDKMIIMKEKGFIIIMMVRGMKEILRKEKEKEKEFTIITLEIVMKEIGKMIKEKEKVFIIS